MIIPVDFDDRKLVIGLTVGPNTNITGVTISYIVFSPATAPFMSYGGSLVRNKFSGMVDKDITHNIYRTPYLLIGVAILSLVNS